MLVLEPEDAKQRVILRQGYRELDELTVEERQPGAAAARVRLVRVRVWVRGVVVEPEQRHPFPAPVCGRRAEADRIPALRVLPDLREASLQGGERFEVAPVVLEPVHANFEAGLDELSQHCVVDVIAVGNEVPAGAEASDSLDLTKRLDVRGAHGRLDVVCQHQGPASALGP